jgi:hypothetical protein
LAADPRLVDRERIRFNDLQLLVEVVPKFDQGRNASAVALDGYN